MAAQGFEQFPRLIRLQDFLLLVLWLRWRGCLRHVVTDEPPTSWLARAPGAARDALAGWCEGLVPWNGALRKGRPSRPVEVSATASRQAPGARGRGHRDS